MLTSRNQVITEDKRQLERTGALSTTVAERLVLMGLLEGRCVESVWKRARDKYRKHETIKEAEIEKKESFMCVCSVLTRLIEGPIPDAAG